MDVDKSEKSMRPQRNRRHSRRAWPPEDDLHLHGTRPLKRLFTPDIKRMLKDWLVRRRENPYPSRDEKKRLAFETGLTYTQICNWFANWRRKLKNSEREKAKKTWGQLIKHYNTNARGNVEQFSISSEDSIWEEERDKRINKYRESYYSGGYDNDNDDDDDELESRDECSSGSCMDRSAGSDGNYNSSTLYTPNFYADSVVANVDVALTRNKTATVKTKYKQQMMEKYLRDTSQKVDTTLHTESQQLSTMLSRPPTSAGAELNKWLESAARFTPNKNNYHIEWNSRRNKPDIMSNPAHVLFTNAATAVARAEQSPFECSTFNTLHHKDELDAAEALANLAFNCRQRMRCAIPHMPQQQAISS